MPGDLREVISKNFEENRRGITAHEKMNGSFSKNNSKELRDLCNM